MLNTFAILDILMFLLQEVEFTSTIFYIHRVINSNIVLYYDIDRLQYIF